MTVFQLFLNILVGVTTSIIFLILGKFYYRIFIPWYENRLYKGVILEGRWRGKREKKIKEEGEERVWHEVEIFWELKQSGYKLSGFFQAKSNDFSNKLEPERYENFYTIKGHILDNHIIMEYCPISRKRIGLGSFVLEVKEGGKKLEGSAAFLEEGDMGIAVFNDIKLDRELD